MTFHVITQMSQKYQKITHTYVIAIYLLNQYNHKQIKVGRRMIKCHKKKKRSNFYINIYLKLCDIRNTNLSIIENGERLLLFLAVEQILHWADFTSFFFNVVNPSMKKKAIPKTKLINFQYPDGSYIYIVINIDKQTNKMK